MTNIVLGALLGFGIVLVAVFFYVTSGDNEIYLKSSESLDDLRHGRRGRFN